MRCQDRGWKINEVEGQQDRCTGFNRGSQDMTVASIRQHKAGGPVLVAAHIGFRENAAHDFESPRQAFTRGASISDQITNPLLMDFGCPTQVDEALDTRSAEQPGESAEQPPRTTFSAARRSGPGLHHRGGLRHGLRWRA